MQYHHGPYVQRGRGIGSIFSGLFRSLKPLASMGIKFGKKVLNSDLAKKVGSTALEFGKEALTNVAADVLEGKSFKESAGEQLAEAKSKLAQTLRGSGKRRKRKRKRAISSDSDSQDSIESIEYKKKPKRNKRYNLLD